jgi:predicted transcriptional regulator
LQENRDATTGEIMDALDLKRSRTQEIVKKLISDEIIEKHGATKGAYYSLKND